MSLMHWLYRKSHSASSSDVGFYSRLSENDARLCKLDVNVKNLTAVAGSIGFFQLDYKLF